MAPDGSIEMFLENNAKVIKTDNNSKNILRKIVHFRQLFVITQKKSCQKTILRRFAAFCEEPPSLCLIDLTAKNVHIHIFFLFDIFFVFPLHVSK